MMEKTIWCIALYIAEALITYTYTGFVFAKKRKPLREITAYVLIYSVLYFCFNIGNVLLNAGMYLLGMYLLLSFNYDCKSKTAFLHGLFLSCTLLLTELLATLGVSIVTNDYGAYQDSVAVYVTACVISKLLYLTVIAFSIRFLPHRKLQDDSKMTVLFCILPVVSMVVALVSTRIALAYALNPGTEVMVIINIASLLVVNLLFMMLYYRMRVENEEKLLLQLSVEKEKAETAYYQALQEETESRNILLHDIKNHLRMINSLACKGENQAIASYISNMEKNMQTESQLRRCDDPILNLILQHTAQECETLGIRFYCDVRDHCCDFMDAPGKTALFSNLLSNAVEGAKEAAVKEIDFSIRKPQDGTSTVISVENTCDVPPVADLRGGFRSRKTEGTLHGTGLKSIARIVKRYNGISTVHYDAEANRFYYIIRFQ